MTDTFTRTPPVEATVVHSAEGPYIGQISADGAITTVEGRTEDGVRREIISTVARLAGQLGHPVRLVAHDSIGTQTIAVSASGYTEALTPVTPAEDAPADTRPSFDDILRPAQRASAATPSVTPPAASPEPAPAADPLPAGAAETVAIDAPLAPAGIDADLGTLLAAARLDPEGRPTDAAPAVPVPTPAESTASALPTLADFMAGRPDAPVGPAELGWQGMVRRMSRGVLNPRPGEAELAHRRAVGSVQKQLDGPRTIVVINPKGGAHKTTATMLLAETFGQYRGGYTLAWDNNETRGTLGWRATAAAHSRTVLDLLHELDRFADPAGARVGDLDGFVRGQGSAQFDVLASDEDPVATELITADAFRGIHRTLQRFYRVIVVDTGNNMRAENWAAAVEAADQLVIVSTVREDTAASAAWLVDGLRERGLGEKVQQAVTVLSGTSAAPDPQLSRRLHGHFGSLTRAVLDVPHDAALVDGGAISFQLLSKRTRAAWLTVAATVADGL